MSTEQGNPVNSATERRTLVLASECEKLYDEITETQHRLTEAQQSSAGLSSSSSSQQPLVTILKEKERLLRAELEVARDVAPKTLLNDPEVINAALLNDFKKEIVQLKETLSLVESQREELQAGIELERQHEQQLTAVKEKLQEKCNSVEAQQAPEDPVETVAQELETKINTARKTEQTIMKRMAKFVSKHFPVPEPTQVSRTSRGLLSRKSHPTEKTIALKDILLELMRKCVESPEDPYMTLDERHWPAYVELLLRCNIVLHHPDDDRRIKLVPFHL